MHQQPGQPEGPQQPLGPAGPQPWPQQVPVPPNSPPFDPAAPQGQSAYYRPPKPPKPPLPLWRRRSRLGGWGAALGVMAIAAGLLIDYGWYNKPVSVINGVCSTSLGQLYAAGHPGVARNCSHAAILDHVLGWLIIGGVVAVVAGFIAVGSARHLRAGMMAPAGTMAPGIGGAVPFPPSPGGSSPGGSPSGTYPFPPSPQG